MGDRAISQAPTDYIAMFHRAIKLNFLKGTELEVTFQDGKTIHYNMEALFSKHPQLQALRDRSLFLAGKLMGYYGIAWNDELDIETETIYRDGILVSEAPIQAKTAAAVAVSEARGRAGLTQKELPKATGIDPSDISKLERGVSNPSIHTLERIAEATNTRLQIKFI